MEFSVYRHTYREPIYLDNGKLEILEFTKHSERCQIAENDVEFLVYRHVYRAISIDGYRYMHACIQTNVHKYIQLYVHIYTHIHTYE